MWLWVLLSATIAIVAHRCLIVLFSRQTDTLRLFQAKPGTQARAQQQAVPRKSPCKDAGADVTGAGAEVKVLRRDVLSFWKQYGPQFSDWWKGLDVASRREFVLAYMKHMPEASEHPYYTEDDGRRVPATRILALVPEVTVRRLTHGPEPLLQLFRARSRHAEELRALECKYGFHMFQGKEESGDLLHVCRMYLSGRLEGSGGGLFYVMTGESGGQRFAQGTRQRHHYLQQMFDEGSAVDADVVESVYERQTVLLATLLVVADAYRQDVLGELGSKYVTHM